MLVSSWAALVAGGAYKRHRPSPRHDSVSRRYSRRGCLLRTTALLLCLIIAVPAAGSDYDFLDQDIQKVLKYRQGRSLGGIYIGRVRPFYVDDKLYLQPMGANVHRKPRCAARNLLRLADKKRSLEFRNKFDILLKSWTAGRDVVLIGTNTCCPPGDEFIFAVIPR